MFMVTRPNATGAALPDLLMWRNYNKIGKVTNFCHFFVNLIDFNRPIPRYASTTFIHTKKRIALKSFGAIRLIRYYLRLFSRPD